MGVKWHVPKGPFINDVKRVEYGSFYIQWADREVKIHLKEIITLETRHYSELPNKRTGPNKRAG